MFEWASSFLLVLTAIFVVVEPFGAVPMFVTLTRGRTPDEMRSIALRAAIIGAAILAFFTLFGGLVFRVLHVELGAFRVAGGLLLLLTSLDMLRGRASACKCSAAEARDGAQKEDIAVIPLAMPMLSGPGAIATVMVLMAEPRGAMGALPVLLAIAVTFTVAYFVLRGSVHVHRVLTPSVMGVVQRILGLLLAAIAIQFIAEGGLEWWKAHRGDV